MTVKNMEEQSRSEDTFYALVSGRVQGVGFRYYTCNEAKRLGLTGWVRNKNTGEVEVLAQGRRENLDTFLAWLRRGPPGAIVDAVQEKPLAQERRYSQFTIEH